MDLKFSDLTSKALFELGFSQLTEVQQQAIPVILKGEDVVVQSRTGTGKTAAFAIPILEKTWQNREIQAIVLVPTRELAIQVGNDFRRIGKHSHARIVVAYGGSSIEKQVELIEEGAQIAVGTPGRILDLIERGKLILSKAQFVVLDEADVMLDMGFSKSVEKILSYTPQKKQVMLFCVDLPSEVLQLARRHLRFPKHVKLVSEDKSAQSVSQCFYQVPSGRKLPVLIHLLKTIKPEKAIVFCKTKHGVRNLARDLDANGFPAEGIQGNLTQGQRDRVMKAFKEGSLKLLVATDVASRGIHVDRISHVFNYELPHDINFYVHRIGRTGRMHAVGEAITLVYSDELGALGQIERLMGKEIQEKKISWEIGEAKHAPREERRFSRGFHGGGRGGGREFRGGGRFGRGGFNSGRRTFSRPPRRQMG